MSKKNTHTFGAVWLRYLAACEGERQKPSTVSTKKGIGAQHLLPLFEDHDINDIGPAEFDDLRARLSHRHAKTVNNVMSILHCALLWAHARELRKKPVPKAGWIKSPAPKIESYTEEQAEALISCACSDDWDPFFGCLVLLGLDAGLRPGEIRALDWSCIDLESQNVRIEKGEYRGVIASPKHSKVREVPLSKRLCEQLQKLGPQDSGFVLLHPDKDKPLWERAHQWLLSRVQRSAKVPVKGPHTLRHTFCTRLALSNVPVPVIKELAGHSDIKTTLRYVHTNQRVLRSAIDLFDGVSP